MKPLSSPELLAEGHEVPVLSREQARLLTRAEFQRLAEVPPEVEWFANIDNPNTRRAYKSDVSGFIKFVGIEEATEFHRVTRAHIIAWRKELEKEQLAAASMARCPDVRRPTHHGGELWTGEVEAQVRTGRSGAEIFDNRHVLPLLIDLAPDELKALQQDNRKFVRTTVREGTNVWKEVGIHVKGAAGSTRDNCLPAARWRTSVASAGLWSGELGLAA